MEIEKMTDDDPFSDGGQLLREMEADPNPPRCDTCGVALFNHLGLTGTCRQNMEAEGKLKSISHLIECLIAENFKALDTKCFVKLYEEILALNYTKKGDRKVNDKAVDALNAANAAAYDVLQDTLKTAYEVERAARTEAHRVYEESKKAKEEVR